MASVGCSSTPPVHRVTPPPPAAWAIQQPPTSDTIERDYFTLRERVTTMEKQLRGGQQWVVEQCR
ncbi:lysis system i-spanin subunit Rz [Hafnia alvei]